MKLKKIIIYIVTLIVLLSSVIPQTYASSVFNRQNKKIFLVLDDSGSMGKEGTYDANYSLQTLVAMLDKNDSVNVYFLNHSNPDIEQINLAQKDNALISNIKEKYHFSDGSYTDYNVVNEVKQKLYDSVSKDDKSDYWLVVFTDGEFGMDAAGDLKTFSQTKLYNGDYPNVLFVTIGSEDSEDDGTFHLVSEDTILASMNIAAEKISNRQKIEKPTYSDGNKTVTFNLPYPARNIIVLTQENETSVTAGSAKSKLSYDEKYNIFYPADTGSNNYNDAIAYTSTVCYVTEENSSSIEAGEVTLTFNKELVPKNTVVLFEPAIEMKVEYFCGDGKIEPKDFWVGQKVTAKYTLCDSERGTELKDDDFDGKIKYNAKVGEDSFDKSEFEFDVKSEEFDVDFAITLPDGHTMEEQEHCVGVVKREITFTLSNAGQFKADYGEINDAEGIDANILVNGAAPETLENFDIEIQGKNFFTSNFDIVPDEQNGKFVIHPKKGFIGVLTPYSKTYEVILTDKVANGTQYKQTLVVEIPGERPWIQLGLWILLLLAIIYLIIVFATKKYFPRGKYFRLYRNNPPIYGEAQRYVAISFSKLMWNEFKMIFSGNFTFFKHLFKQLLPCQALCVTLFGVGSPKSGKFPDITIAADNSVSLIVYDATLRPRQFGGFESSYTLYEQDFMSELALDFLVNVNDKKPKYFINIDQMFAKKQILDTGAPYIYYLQFTNKKKNRREN